MIANFINNTFSKETPHTTSSSHPLSKLRLLSQGCGGVGAYPRAKAPGTQFHTYGQFNISKSPDTHQLGLWDTGKK